MRKNNFKFKPHVFDVGKVLGEDIKKYYNRRKKNYSKKEISIKAHRFISYVLMPIFRYMLKKDLKDSEYNDCYEHIEVKLNSFYIYGNKYYYFDTPKLPKAFKFRAEIIDYASSILAKKYYMYSGINIINEYDDTISFFPQLVVNKIAVKTKAESLIERVIVPYIERELNNLPNDKYESKVFIRFLENRKINHVMNIDTNLPIKDTDFPCFVVYKAATLTKEYSIKVRKEGRNIIFYTTKELFTSKKE